MVNVMAQIYIIKIHVLFFAPQGRRLVDWCRRSQSHKHSRSLGVCILMWWNIST